MAITTAEKRGRLEDAFAKCNGSLRKTLRAAEQSARALVSGGSIKSTKANNQEAVFQDYGPGQITSLELAELYRELVDEYDEAFNFLTYCCLYGLDPFISAFQGYITNNLVVSPTNVLLDTTGRFNTLCQQFEIPSVTVIGVSLAYQAIFLWMMYFIVSVRETHSDYSLMIVGTGGAQFT